MARETLASLRQDRDDWKKLFEQANADLSEVTKQLNLKVEDTTKYQSMQQQLLEEKRNKKSALASSERYKKELEDLRSLYADLKAKYDAEHTKNPRGAGRKPALTPDQQQQAIKMRDAGHSFEEIGKAFGISRVAIANLYKRNANNQ